MFYDLDIYKNKQGFYTVCMHQIAFKNDLSIGEHKHYSYKLDNSISRAKNKIYDYVINNEFCYFVTLTLNDSNNRYDLKSARSNINQIIRNMRRRNFKNLHYLLIPEKHKSGAIHFHGFFSSGFGEDFYINENGYLSWGSYDYMGFSSISKIKDFKASCLYITKYINKDLCKTCKGEYLYFHSRGLKSSQKIATFTCAGLIPLNFDFKNKFVSKKLINYYEYITLLDFLNNNNKIYSSQCDKAIVYEPLYSRFIAQNLHFVYRRLGKYVRRRIKNY